MKSMIIMIEDPAVRQIFNSQNPQEKMLFMSAVKELVLKGWEGLTQNELDEFDICGQATTNLKTIDFRLRVFWHDFEIVVKVVKAEIKPLDEKKTTPLSKVSNHLNSKNYEC